LTARHAFVHPDDIATYSQTDADADPNVTAGHKRRVKVQRIVIWREHDGPCDRDGACKLLDIGTAAKRRAWMATNPHKVEER